MSPRRRRSILWIFIPIFVVFALLLVSIDYLLDPNIYRNIIQKSLEATLEREVSLGQAKLSLWGGVGIAFEDVRVRDRSQSFDLLESKRLILKVHLFPLLKKEIKWKQIVLDRPIFRLVRNSLGQYNTFIGGPLTGEKLKETQKKILKALTSLFGGSLAIQEGELIFSDERLGDPPLKTEIRSFNFELSKGTEHQDVPFKISGKMVHRHQEGFFSISGVIQNISENLDYSKGGMEAEVKIKGFDTSHFWPYLKMLLPMETLSGILDMNGRFQGDFQGRFKTSAKIKLREVLFDYPRVFSSVLKPKWTHLEVEVQYDLKEITVPRFSIELPELWVKAKGKIYGIGSKEMGMEAEAHSSAFDIAEGKKYIPFRIITPDVSDHLFRAEGKGSFQIKSVKLSGRMPEIDHCDQLINAHVLSVEALLHGAQLKLPWNLPTFEDLSGQLLFQMGHLYLKEVNGRIFNSTLEKVNGTFYELLHIPTLQMNCQGRFDLTDLSSLSKSEGFPETFDRALSSIHILSGKANYSLSAKGLLKPPIRFQHQGKYRLSKTRLIHQHIPFPIQIGEGEVELSHQDLRWSEAKVEFGHSSLLINGSLKHGEKDLPLEIVAKGRVDLKNLFALIQTPLFPEEVKSRMNSFEALSGATQVSFKGKILPGISRFFYEGEFLPREASLLPRGNLTPLVFKEGNLSLSNSGVVFSKAKFLFGKSSLTIDGSIQEGNTHLSTWGLIDLKPVSSFLKTPFFSHLMRGQIEDIPDLSGEAEVRLKWFGKGTEGSMALREGEVRLKKIFFQHPRILVPISDIEGSLRLLPEEIRFEGLKGKVGNSPIHLSGTVSRTAFSGSIVGSSKSELDKKSTEPMKRLTFQVSSSQLDLDDIFPKRKDPSPISFEKIRDWLLYWSCEGNVAIDQGNWGSLHFQDLKAEMKTMDGKLQIGLFQFKSEGGDFWGEGWIQPTARGIRFEVKPRFSNMEAKAFIRALLQKEEEERVLLTGRVHIDKVELRGEGENFQKAKEALNGSLRVEVEEGVIERWGTLSKIFSILNVSQLFKGRLPDLKTKGLPYHQISGNFFINDGIASIDDFVVDSDAMRITLIGKIDLGKNLIDARIGVHPLITIDTILSNVPIAGYILTGKDKGFISYFYEVKGNLDNPTIEAIPLKSIEERSWGVIKRLLETPLRPFQKAPFSNNKPKK
ncbi:MAG: AsmA-like C-terminal domain-containing protein [Syntrophaceae bacterium]|nr:AsmA-like C-terminal domain-containing protein [Syntrophaceae bacterium]